MPKKKKKKKGNFNSLCFPASMSLEHFTFLGLPGEAAWYWIVDCSKHVTFYPIHSVGYIVFGPIMDGTSSWSTTCLKNTFVYWGSMVSSGFETGLELPWGVILSSTESTFCIQRKIIALADVYQITGKNKGPLMGRTRPSNTGHLASVLLGFLSF